MIVPGSNLLNMAFNLIRPQSIKWYRDIGREKTADGEYITQLASPITVDKSSVQAVDRNEYGELGLSASRSYFIWYASRDITGVERGKSGDIVEWNGRRFRISSDRPWYGMDGWDGSLMVDVGPATGSLTAPPYDPKERL